MAGVSIVLLVGSCGGGRGTTKQQPAPVKTQQLAGTTLTAGSTTLTLRDRKVEPDRPLVGTTWILNSVIDHNTTSGAVDASSTVRLTSDGRIELDERCAGFRGRVEVHDTSFTVREVERVRQAKCVGPALVTLWSFLAGTIRYAIDADRLTLSGPEGKGFGFHAQSR
jgi:heat shock protein HslJ